MKFSKSIILTILAVFAFAGGAAVAKVFNLDDVSTYLDKQADDFATAYQEAKAAQVSPTETSATVPGR